MPWPTCATCPWRAGAAISHRRITPDTLARLEDGTAVIAGWLNGDNASGPANTALDKVQLLVLFAALIGVEPRWRPPARRGETRL